MKLIKGGVVGKTHKIDKFTHKIRLVLGEGIEWDTPWVHIRKDPNRHCHYWQMIESVFNFIPTPCLNCWKVVVRPKTVVDLFKVYNMMVEMNKDRAVYCKCGVEIGRPYVEGLYGGYFYCDGKDAGLSRLKQVRRLIEEKDINAIAILKRYCTEFEGKHGDSKGYNQPYEAKEMEKMLAELIVIPKASEYQPQYLLDHIMEYWIRFASQYGDSTYRQLNEGDPLIKQPRTYEE